MSSPKWCLLLFRSYCAKRIKKKTTRWSWHHVTAVKRGAEERAGGFWYFRNIFKEGKSCLCITPPAWNTWIGFLFCFVFCLSILLTCDLLLNSTTLMVALLQHIDYYLVKEWYCCQNKFTVQRFLIFLWLYCIAASLQTLALLRYCVLPPDGAILLQKVSSVPLWENLIKSPSIQTV